MTMHLVRPYLSTTRYNIQKPKLKQKDIEARKEHEKFLKKMGAGEKITLDFVGDGLMKVTVPSHKLSSKVLIRVSSASIFAEASCNAAAKYTGQIY